MQNKLYVLLCCLKITLERTTDPRHYSKLQENGCSWVNLGKLTCKNELVSQCRHFRKRYCGYLEENNGGHHFIHCDAISASRQLIKFSPILWWKQRKHDRYHKTLPLTCCVKVLLCDGVIWGRKILSRGAASSDVLTPSSSSVNLIGEYE